MGFFSAVGPLIGIALFFAVLFSVVGQLSSHQHPPKVEKQPSRNRYDRVYSVDMWRLSRYHGDYERYIFTYSPRTGEIRSPSLRSEVKIFAIIMAVLYACGLLFPTLTHGFSWEWTIGVTVIFGVIFIAYCLWEWYRINKAHQILEKTLKPDDNQNKKNEMRNSQ